MDASYVYFIQDTKTGHVKIGYTGNVQERLRHLQTGSASPLRLLGYIEGDSLREGVYHDRLVAHSVHGEWFRRDATFDLMRSIPVERWIWVNPGNSPDGLRLGVRSERTGRKRRRMTAEQKRARRAANQSLHADGFGNGLPSTSARV